MIFSAIRNSILFFLFLSPAFSAAQIVIQGTVLSEATGLPVEGASVYFNNTSVGTSASAAGKFSIPLPPMLNAELIVSAVGFQLLVFKPDAESVENKRLVFKLTPKEQQLKDVLILTDAVRKKYLALFEKNFLGITEEASMSAIKNRKDIYFTSGGIKNSFKACSDTPLVVINKMLGYKISFELGEFFYDENNGRTFYYGYTRFEEMGDKKRWIRNRRQCYYGSTVHFYRSLIANDLKKQGYAIYLIQPLHDSTDSSNNRNQKKEMKPPDEMQGFSVARGITATQIIAEDSSNGNNYKVTIPGKLMVQYSKEPSSKEYLKKNTLVEGNLPVGFRTYITVKAPAIILDKAGIVANPLEVEYSGYWIYEKAASMLPFNYTPE
jgi:CarboxypepD_reg-like domain